MDYVLVFRPEVRDELEEAYNWYESQRLGLGDQFLNCVDEIVDRIRSMPESYAIVHRDLRRAVVQRFPCAVVQRFPYAVYYRIVSSRIIVIAVFHGRRDPKSRQMRR